VGVKGAEREVPDFCYDMSQYVREKWEESGEGRG